MDIIIGKQGNQPFKLTESSISRQHALFHLDEATGKMTLKDSNSTNGTWILARDGKFKRLVGEAPVGLNTLVRLGASATFRVKDLLVKPAAKLVPSEEKPVDISKLRMVYECYNQNKMNLESKTSNIMMWRMASLSLGGIFAVMISLILPKEVAGNETISAIIKISGSILAIGISWFVVDMKSKGLIQKKDQNERYFKKNYCCPKCGFHFGLKLYENILAEGKCPNASCRCKFTGK